MVNEQIMAEAMNTILSPVKNVNIRLSESIFVNDYLPYFVNEEAREEAIHKWLEVCKHPYYSVDIVDKEGNVLFTVPPLWLRQSTRLDTEDSISVSEVITRAQIKAEITPANGEKFFNECMPYILPEPEQDDDFSKIWINIFKRYGYISEDTTKTELDNVDIQYDFTEI